MLFFDNWIFMDFHRFSWIFVGLPKADNYKRTTRDDTTYLVKEQETNIMEVPSSLIKPDLPSELAQAKASPYLFSN